jgi:hypothetical protein
MLVKINSINETENKVQVTVLDIDDNGTLIPLKEIELKVPSNDKIIIAILKNSPYAAIFTAYNEYDNNKDNIIILASGMTNDDIDNEKKKVIDIIKSKRRKS